LDQKGEKRGTNSLHLERCEGAKYGDAMLSDDVEVNTKSSMQVQDGKVHLLARTTGWREGNSREGEKKGEHRSEIKFLG